MSRKIREISPHLQKAVDLGIIDGWFRGLVALTPQQRHAALLHTKEITDRRFQDFNTHTLSYGSYEKISQPEIESMVGFRQLMQACNKNDVQVNVISHGKGALEVSFDPDKTFPLSQVFGARYTKIVPMACGPSKN